MCILHLALKIFPQSKIQDPTIAFRTKTLTLTRLGTSKIPPTVELGSGSLASFASQLLTLTLKV